MNYELSRIIEKISGRFICVFNGDQREFKDINELSDSCFGDGCTVESISAQNDVVVITLKLWNTPTADVNHEWADDEKLLSGKEPSFF